MYRAANRKIQEERTGIAHLFTKLLTTLLELVALVLALGPGGCRTALAHFQWHVSIIGSRRCTLILNHVHPGTREDTLLVGSFVTPIPPYICSSARYRQGDRQR